MPTRMTLPKISFVLSFLFVILFPACAPLNLIVVETVTEFAPEQNELPEGIALDSTGNIYVSLASLGEVRKITPNGTQSVLTTLNPEEGFGLLGLAVDASDQLYAALSSSNPDTNGVYQITSSGESVQETAPKMFARTLSKSLG